MGDLREVLPGVWTWHVHERSRGLDFNGWYLRADDVAVVIDPPPAPDSVMQDIGAMGRPVAVLLTNLHHARASAAFRAAFDCPIEIHEDDAPRLQTPAQGTFRHGNRLAGGLLAVTLADSKTPGETAFLLRGEVDACFIGDAVIGTPPGQLAMLPDEKFADPAAAKRGLRALLEHPFDALLLGDGTSIPEGGRRALEAFLAT